jgi:hypothetical protein
VDLHDVLFLIYYDDDDDDDILLMNLNNSKVLHHPYDVNNDGFHRLDHHDKDLDVVQKVKLVDVVEYQLNHRHPIIAIVQ